MSAYIHWQPKDRSLGAFKEWFEAKYQLDPKGKRSMMTAPWLSESEWVEYWQTYWARVDGSSTGRNPNEKL